MHKIPVTVLSGFLGAGKTTLVQSLLAQAGDKKMALIINEFGTQGVDGDLIKGCGDALCDADALVELANGCICCTVADDFIPTMQMLLNRDPRPDHIIIETSGLALPQPLIKAFNWPEIKADVMIDGVINLVDADALARGQFVHDKQAVQAQRQLDDSLDHETPLSELFHDQLGSADLVVLNKVDLVDQEAHELIMARLQTQIRSGVPVLKAVRGDIDASLLMGLDTDSAADTTHDHTHDHDDESHHHHDHADFFSFIVPIAPIADRVQFEKHIKRILRDHPILRLKGFVHMHKAGARLVVQAVGPRLSTHFEQVAVSDDRSAGSLVVIGLKGLDQIKVTQQLQRVLKAA